ncbi:MAG: bifunctional precorrin-2 dehydrogenase/sirohydrochlorin ferrochelatase [Bacteroidota bacterium]
MPTPTNQLYPIFLRLDRLELLIVGGGQAGAEKLRFLMKNSPNARVSLVAETTNPEVRALLRQYPQVRLFHRAYSYLDLNGKDIVIAATDDAALNYAIWDQAKRQKLLVNVADTPSLCDFYLGSIVTKGELKIAISTNGKSPTLAKRIRQVLEEAIPQDVEELLQNLHTYRNRLKVSFATKVDRLNALTRGFLEN